MKTMSGPILVDFTMSFHPAQSFPFQQHPELISLPPWLTNRTNKISSSSSVKLILSRAALCQILYGPLNPSFCSPREFIFFNAVFQLLSQKTPFAELRLVCSICHLYIILPAVMRIKDVSFYHLDLILS